MPDDGQNMVEICSNIIKNNEVFLPKFVICHLKTKRRPLYLKTQSVPRSKHF